MNQSTAAPLKSVLKEAQVGFAEGRNPERGILQFRMNNIDQQGQIDLSKRRRVPGDTPDIAKYLLEPGDVLLNVTNSPHLVGKAAFYPGLDEPAVFSNHFLRLRPRTDQLYGPYLARWLHLLFRRGVFKTLCRQWVNQATLNRDLLLRQRIPLPALSEQRRIAEILGRADTLRARRRAAIEELDQLARSIFLEMFGDPHQAGWEMTTTAAVAAPGKGSIRTGPFGSQLLHSEFTDSGIAVLGIDNAVENEFRWSARRCISESKYQKLKRYTVRPGDVLITIMGTCGRCAIVPDDIPPAINTKHLCCITLDRRKCLPEFLHAYFLHHPLAKRYLLKKSKGAIMSGLNMGIIKQMPIPLAPLDLQRSFADRIAALDRLKATHRAHLAELDALFASLQHRAFRGEL